jgi:drug/metabolite transporter (DMT)-like permease
MRSKILTSPLPYLALLIAHIIWGANFVVAKVALEEFPVMSLAFLRYLLAFLLLLPFFITLDKKYKHFNLKHIPQLIWAGIFMVTLNIALFYWGLQRSEAIDASVLSLILPVISVIGGWWFLKEKIYLVNLWGIILGLLGALFIIGLPLIFAGQMKSDSLVGNLLLVSSNVCAVIGMLIAKNSLKTYSPLVVTAGLFLVGVVTFAIPAILEYINNPIWIQHVSILGVLSLMYITVLSSVCAYFLLIWGVEKTSVTQANLFQYIEPAIAATLAVPILGERISYSFIVGTVMVALGVYWGTLGKAHHHHYLHKHHRS